MAEVKWIKIVTDVFDDEKILMIESMPEADGLIVIWFKLLCLAGKQNNSGVFQMGQMPYTDEMFSTIFRRPLNTVRLALKTFEQFGMIEIVNNTVTIPNWGKHQNIDQIEAKTAYMKSYMRAYREKQKLISSGESNRKANSKANVSSADKKRKEEKRREENKDICAAFDQFWSAYPKKINKQGALKAFEKVDVPVETLLSALENHKKSAQWTKDGGQYIPHPTTWLNQRRWEAELPEDKTPPKGASGQLGAAEIEALKMMLEG